MYEEMTYEKILQDKLARISDSLDKREGAVIYDACAPNSVEAAIMYMELDMILNQTFADTSTGTYLELRCAERGINREPATCAVMEGVFTPTTLNIIGKRFNCGEYNYTVTAGTDVAGTYQLTCETPGSIINGVTGALVPIDYVEGLKTATITNVLVPGEDVENDDTLRARYFDTLSSQAFGGNVTDYKVKTKAIDGVGGVKVTPAWNGGGTVLLTIVDSEYKKPSDTLVSKVQKEMSATAPIGHVVTTNGVVELAINISANITYQSGWSWESAKEYIQKAIDDYFTELSKEWETVENLVVRISQIETRILACSGVVDISGTTLNGGTANIQLDTYVIPIRGSVSDGT